MCHGLLSGSSIALSISIYGINLTSVLCSNVQIAKISSIYFLLSHFLCICIHGKFWSVPEIIKTPNFFVCFVFQGQTQKYLVITPSSTQETILVPKTWVGLMQCKCSICSIITPAPKESYQGDVRGRSPSHSALQ